MCVSFITSTSTDGIRLCALGSVDTTDSAAPTGDGAAGDVTEGGGRIGLWSYNQIVETYVRNPSADIHVTVQQLHSNMVYAWL